MKNLVLAALTGLLFATPTFGQVEGGGGDFASAQIINFTGNTTLTGGILGDATLIESGIVTTVINTDGNGARVTTTGGTSGNQFTLSTSVGNAGDTAVDPSALLFATNAYADSSGSPGQDDDDGAGAFEEYQSDEGALVNGAGEINIQYDEVAGADGDISIVFGYDILDISARTHNSDFFRIENLLAGSTFDVATLADIDDSDGDVFGFFDSRLRVFDSAQTELLNLDGDAGYGFLEDTLASAASITTPGDGILFIEVSHSGDPSIRAGGTYNLRLSGVSAVPEPGSLAVLGLAGLGLAFIRRRK